MLISIFVKLIKHALFQICDAYLHRGATPIYDVEHKVHYTYLADQWASFDYTRDLEIKVY